MIYLVIGLFLAITLVVLGLVGDKKWLMGISVAVLLVAILLGSIATVPTGHTGVVTTFGKVENMTLDAGVHMIKPWQQVVKMDNRVQKRTVQLACFSSDIQEVRMAYTINYQIKKSDAMTLYRTVGISYYETVVSPNIAEAVKVAAARYTAEQLVGKRDTLADDIEKILIEKLEPYNIEVVSTSIEDLDFTDGATRS